MLSAAVITHALTLKLPITTIVFCFAICLWFKKSFLQTVWTQIRLLLLKQSDQGQHSFPVCKNRFEKFSRIFSRQHKQTTFWNAGFLGILRVNLYHCLGRFSRWQIDSFFFFSYFSHTLDFEIHADCFLRKQQSLFSEKNKKKYFKMLSAESFPQQAK